jgi:hypothetical protein
MIWRWNEEANRHDSGPQRRACGLDQFQNFGRAFHAPLTVPKAAVLKEDGRWRCQEYHLKGTVCFSGRTPNVRSGRKAIRCDRPERLRKGVGTPSCRRGEGVDTPTRARQL